MKLNIRIKKNIIFLFALILFSGCENKDNPKEIFLNVSSSKLIYLGEIEDKAGLVFNWENDTLKCVVRTVFIMEGDTLNSITASTIDKNLTLKIITKPYNNLYWNDVDKLTKVHDVEFKVTGLKSGTYNLNLHINNVATHWENFSVR